jgi:hypothetical protein
MPAASTDRIFSHAELRRIAAGLLPPSIQQMTGPTGSLLDWCVATQVRHLILTPEGRAEILERLSTTEG